MNAYDELRDKISRYIQTSQISVHAARDIEVLVEQVKTNAYNEGRRDGYTQAHTNHAQQPPRNPPTP